MFDHIAERFEVPVAVSRRPDLIRCRSRWSWTVPARQGMHLPHDSSMQNSMKNRATSTMLVSWSMTIIPHDDHTTGAHDRPDLSQ